MWGSRGPVPPIGRAAIPATVVRVYSGRPNCTRRGVLPVIPRKGRGWMYAENASGCVVRSDHCEVGITPCQGVSGGGSGARVTTPVRLARSGEAPLVEGALRGDGGVGAQGSRAPAPRPAGSRPDGVPAGRATPRIPPGGRPPERNARRRIPPGPDGYRSCLPDAARGLYHSPVPALGNRNCSSPWEPELFQPLGTGTASPRPRPSPPVLHSAPTGPLPAPTDFVGHPFRRPENAARLFPRHESIAL